MQRDDADTVQAMLPELQAIPPDPDSTAVTGRSFIIAWLHMYEGEYQRAREILDDGAAHGASPGRRMMARCLEGMSHSLEGRVVDAERIFREVLQEAEAQGAAHIGVAGMAAGLLGDALYELNELEAAWRLLETRIDVLERTSLPDTVMRALLVLSSAAWLQGRRLEAQAYLDRLDDYATRHDLPRQLAPALALRLRWHLRRGEIDQADATLRRIVGLTATRPGVNRGWISDVTRWIDRARADMCLHWNDFDAALTLLRPLVESSEATRRGRGVVGLRLQIAVAEQGRGHHAPARAQLLEGLRLGHRLGLVRTLLDVSPAIPRMLEALLRDGALDPVLAFYGQRICDASARARASAQAVPDAAIVREPVLSDRELQVLALVAQALPNKKIARVLGVTPHTVKWHLAKIYLKLGVAERGQAVARVRDLGIELPSAHSR